MVDLSQDAARIFRITHIENVPWILENGLYCRNGSRKDPQFRRIGNEDLIAKRSVRTVPISPGGTFSDYIPFYFTPLSPMLLNIKTGYNGVRMVPMRDIAIIVTSLPKIAAASIPFVFTDRHANLNAARFSSKLDDLDRIDWEILRNRDFKQDPNKPEKMERYQAEAMIHGSLPISSLLGIACYDRPQAQSIRQHCDQRSLSLPVIAKPGWFF